MPSVEMACMRRREWLRLAVGMSLAVGAFGYGSDFWNRKQPGEWSGEEIDQLISRSPWAKEVTGQYSRPEGMSGSRGDDDPTLGGGQRGGIGGGGGVGGGGRGGMGGGIGGGGGMGGGLGIPGIGGGGRGGRGGMGGGRMPEMKGIVQWESAAPVAEALKVTVPEAFAGHYVISVNDFPMGGRNRTGDSPEDLMEKLKYFTTLQPKGRKSVQAGVVQRQPSSRNVSLLFGFSKELLEISADDKEVLFATHLGPMEVKAKFLTKEMMYHGKLAV